MEKEWQVYQDIHVGNFMDLVISDGQSQVTWYQNLLLMDMDIKLLL